MDKAAMPQCVLATVFGVILLAAPAQAQNDKTWVAQPPFGDDAHGCTRSAPCATVQRAHDQTNAGGEVGFVDSGEYLPFSITKSISIVAEGVDVTIVQPTPNVAVNVQSGTSDNVRLQGLIFDGVGMGRAGIFWLAGHGQLEIRNCVMRNFTSQEAAGIVSVEGGNKLIVADTVVANNGAGTTGAGILIKPTQSGGPQVLLERVTAVNNVFGIAVDGSFISSTIDVTIADSVVHGNSQDGIVATNGGGGAPIAMTIENTSVVNNNLGIRSTGAGIAVRVGNSTLTGNGTALTANLGGALLSFGSNEVEGNGVNGAFSGSVTLK